MVRRMPNHHHLSPRRPSPLRLKASAIWPDSLPISAAGARCLPREKARPPYASIRCVSLTHGPLSSLTYPLLRKRAAFMTSGRSFPTSLQMLIVAPTRSAIRRVPLMPTILKSWRRRLLANISHLVESTFSMASTSHVNSPLLTPRLLDQERNCEGQWSSLLYFTKYSNRRARVSALLIKTTTSRVLF